MFADRARRAATTAGCAGVLVSGLLLAAGEPAAATAAVAASTSASTNDATSGATSAPESIGPRTIPTAPPADLSVGTAAGTAAGLADGASGDQRLSSTVSTASTATAGVGPHGATLTYAAASGQTNTVEATMSWNAARTKLLYRIDDSVPIRIGRGCTHPDPADRTLVRCSLTPQDRPHPYVSLSMVLRDRDDSVVFRNNSTQSYYRNDFRLGSGNDTLAAGNPRTVDATVVHGQEGDDRITTGSGRQTLYGGPGDDLLRAGGGRDRLYGGRDDDRLHGGSGADLLHGNSGNDRLFGGPGRDRISGGPGRDLPHP